MKTRPLFVLILALAFSPEAFAKRLPREVQDALHLCRQAQARIAEGKRPKTGDLISLNAARLRMKEACEGEKPDQRLCEAYQTNLKACLDEVRANGRQRIDEAVQKYAPQNAAPAESQPEPAANPGN